MLGTQRTLSLFSKGVKMNEKALMGRHEGGCHKAPRSGLRMAAAVGSQPGATWEAGRKGGQWAGGRHTTHLPREHLWVAGCPLSPGESLVADKTSTHGICCFHLRGLSVASGVFTAHGKLYTGRPVRCYFTVVSIDFHFF